MPQDPLDYATPDARQRWPLAATVFLSAGLYVLACIPAVFAFEALRWPQYPIHTTQLVACLICFFAATLHLLTADRANPSRFLAVSTRAWAALVVTLTAGFLLLMAVLIATLDFSSID